MSQKNRESSTIQILNRLKKVEGPNVTFVGNDFPIVMKKAKGCKVTDVENKSYWDFTSCFGVLALGHRHKVALTAMRQQGSRLIHGMGDVHPTLSKVQLLECLQKLLPMEGAKTVLSSGGGESIDTALKTAFLVTKRSQFICFSGGYHGLQLGPLLVNGRGFFTDGFEDFLSERRFVLPFPVHSADYGNLDQFKETTLWKQESGKSLALPEIVLELAEEVLKTKKYAGLLVEPMQGRAGERSFPPLFLQKLHQLCKKYGTLLIADEIFTGFWRTGTPFACEWNGVVPDLICTGKALGGGFPLSACSGYPLEIWGNSVGESRHTSTFLGHPLACAVGVASLMEMKRIHADRQKAEKVLDSSLSELVSKVTMLGERNHLVARGRGLMRGIWLGANSPGSGVEISESLLKRGFLTLPSGMQGDVLALTPPHLISEVPIARLFHHVTEHLKSAGVISST